MANEPATPDHVLSMDDMPDQKLRTRIARISLSSPNGGGNNPDDVPLIQITGAAGQTAALMAIRSPIRLHVIGPLGDYSLSYCNRCDIRVDGNGGHGIAEGLCGGSIRFRGNVGHGAGVAMAGGTLAIFGSAGDRVGAAMFAGELFVRGDVGDDAGVAMRGGTLVVGGDAGDRLGDHRGLGTIYLRGTARSLAESMVEVPLKKRDELRLGVLLINASIRGAAKEFRRVIPERLWRFEQSRETGEVRPNWR
jgi:glutamate synthase domain-containing protein 3